jgi:hypothetical protein
MSEQMRPSSAEGNCTELGMDPVSASHDGILEAWLMGLIPTGMVAVPYVTLTLPFRTALKAQATLILALTLSLLVVGLLRRGWWPRLRSTPRPVLMGLLLYASVTILGALVGLVRGNNHEFLAGQALSMALLPLSALGGLVLCRSASWRGFTVGVAGSVTVLAVVHLGVVTARLASGKPTLRTFLGNGTSPVDTSLLAFILLIALVGWLPGWLRRVAIASMVLLVVFALATLVRGLWITMLLGGLIAGFCSVGHRIFVSRRLWFGLAAALAALGVVWLVVLAWWQFPRYNLLEALARQGGVSGAPVHVTVDQTTRAHALDIVWRPTAGSREFSVGAPFPVSSGGDYQLRASVTGHDGGTGFIEIQWLAAGGRVLEVLRTPLPATGASSRAAVVSSPPLGTVRAALRVGCDENASGTWSASAVTLERLGPHVLTLLHDQQREIGDRLLSLVPGCDQGKGQGADSVAFRLEESKILARLFTSGSWGAKLFGRGLGAVHHLGAIAVPDFGTEDTNYIHNFYFFLLVKLGLVGAALAGWALFLWLTWTWRACRAAAPGAGRAFLAAGTAAWIAYLVWSVASPQLADFRMVPFLGLLLAASASARP